MLRYQLIGATQQYPRARTLVFYLGAGAPESEQPPRDFNLPDGAVDGGAVLGYGTADGGPIPGTDVARSAVDEPDLRAIADQIGVPYVPAQRCRVGRLRGADRPRRGRSRGRHRSPRTRRETELYWAPALLAAVLILVELYLVLREFRRTRLVTTGVLE